MSDVPDCAFCVTGAWQTIGRNGSSLAWRPHGKIITIWGSPPGGRAVGFALEGMSRLVVPRYFSRELSWLEFNQRVLDEALDPKTPLLERVKFFCICSSNLDEFFEVRVAGIKLRFVVIVAPEPSVRTGASEASAT